jgi:uncharacterized protein YggE
MNRSSCFCLFLALALPQLALAQLAPAPPLVTVTGSAEVKVKPDLAVLGVGVRANAAKLEAARADYDTRIRAALEVLKQQAIKDDDIATSDLSINVEYDRERSGTRVVTYTVNQELTVRLHDIAKADPLLTALLKAGVNIVNGVSYQTSELRKHRDTARQMAIKAAREKAEALTSELGARRGKVYSIREISDRSYGSANAYNGNMQVQAAVANPVDAEVGNAASGTLASGLIGIAASIEVAFVIE